MFKVGDWVQITPTPDYRWSQWYNQQDIYKEFLDKIGVIQDITDDDERPGEFLYSVKVYFPYGLDKLGAGSYYEWFRGYHLIRSSQAAANTRNNMATAGKELQEWENFKKKSTDKMLRHIFGQESEEDKKDKNKLDDPNQWDLKTPSDDYDSYYDDAYYRDYNSYMPVYDYENKTDVDYYYYYDTSASKTNDKD